MKRCVRSIALLSTGAVTAATSLAVATPAAADDVPQPLPIVQQWTDTTLIAAEDDWTDVPGIVGHQGNEVVAATGVDPRTVTNGANGVVDVFANRTDEGTFPTGGVAEFELADPVVALQGSGTADAPNLVATLSTTGFVGITVGFTARDVDSTTDNAMQPVALQYRIGTAGDFTTVDGGYVADATQGPSLAGATTAVAATLPAAADDQPVVQLRILTTNAAGNDEWVGIDDLAVSGTPGGGGPAGPVAACPATLDVVEGDTGAAVVSATDTDSTIADIAVSAGAVDGITLTPTGPGAASLVVAATVPAGTYPVTIAFTTDDGQTTSCTVTVTIAAVTLISEIQGSGAASRMVGDAVIVDAIATSLFTRQDVADGFFVQEEDGDADDDAATAEGLFVFCRGSCPAVAAGDLVRLRGSVAEFFEMTQVSVAGSGSVDILSSGHELPASVDVGLPAGVPTKDPSAFESVEGMVVTVDQELTVTEHFELARYGQIELTSGLRPYQFTHDDEPSIPGYAAHLAQLAARTIILDDDNNDQNDAVTDADPDDDVVVDEAYPYPSGGLSTTNDVRAGDTVDGLTGVMHYSFAGLAGTDAWRLRPIPGLAYTFDESNPRPATVDRVGGRLRVAAFNVLNYFATIDTASSNQTGTCGPLATLDCRGADSTAELDRQRAKEVAAIGALDADVVGLVELQNDSGAAVADLLAGLNARGAAPYAAVDTKTIGGPAGTVGGDAIKVAFIYRPSAVTPVGDPDVLNSTDDPRFIDTLNRPVVIQQFEENATGARFTAAVNHFKSKGSACNGDPDRLDGQGNCNGTRTAAAEALADHLDGLVAGGWDPDVIILGDLNAYRNEDPITTLQDAGYTDLIEEVIDDEAYSYLFDGQLGYLDHALANETMAAQVTGVTEWHVNADEVALFDYNDTVRDEFGEATFERESTVRELYAPDARRSSDHDPVVVGLQLASLTIDDAVIIGGRRGGGLLVLSGTTGASTATCPTLALEVDATAISIGRTTQLGASTICVSLTSRGLVTFDRRTGAVAAVLSLPTSFRVTSDVVRFVLSVNATEHAVDRAGRRNGLIWAAS